MGYYRAGFDVVGVDIKSQPRYPFGFYCMDWREALEMADAFDAIHASPPCQRYTKASKLQGNEHPDLVAEVRDALRATGLPYVIENVPGAPLENPTLLCGTMFALPLYRHRLFETSFEMPFMLHHPHAQKQTKMGRPPKDGEIIQVVGHFSDVPAGRKAMGIDWMTQSELAEAIPPAFTEHIGKQLMAAIVGERAA